MPRWTLFTGVVGLTLGGVVLLAVSEHRTGAPGASTTGEVDGPPELSTGLLLANLLVVHGLVGGVLLGAAWYADVPWSALGLPTSGAAALASVPLGVGIGLALTVGNEVAAAATRRLGVGPDERVRSMVAPDSAGGWAVLVLFALPFGAAVEEFAFRGVVVGALAVAHGVSPWLLAVVSSVAFGVGHGLQGPGGVVVTGALGLALAAAFVLTGSLVTVVTAHYVVNAVEFAVHEGTAGHG